jgi:type II secretory ATPase GspE/PulE/Tfp pilus assembly ATPase PilB-like protein
MGIGSVLLERGLIDRAGLERALAEQRETGERLDRVLVRLGLVSRGQVLEVIGDQFDMQVVDLATVEVEPKTLASLPAKLVYKQRCVPIRQTDSALTIATSDPFELMLDELRLLTGSPSSWCSPTRRRSRSSSACTTAWGRTRSDEMAGRGGVAAEKGGEADQEIEQAQEASVIKLVNDLLIEAIRERATDVHIEPYEQPRVRYRIDGVLQRANVPRRASTASATRSSVA